MSENNQGNSLTGAVPHERLVSWFDVDENILEGWYATYYSWDEREGAFVSPEYHNREDWVNSLPISMIAGPFSCKDDAQLFCDENDISW